MAAYFFIFKGGLFMYNGWFKKDNNWYYYKADKK